MMQIALRTLVVLAVSAVVGLGSYYAGLKQGWSEGKGSFQLVVEAQAGETTIRCRGCQFLYSWPTGQAEVSRSFTGQCNDATSCKKTVWAKLAADVVADAHSK